MERFCFYSGFQYEVCTSNIIIGTVIRNQIYFWKGKHLPSPWLRSVAQSLYQIGAFCTSDAKLQCLHKHQHHCKISLGFKNAFWVMNYLSQQRPDGPAKRIAMTELCSFSKPFPCWLQFLSKHHSAFIECVNLLHPAAPRLAASPSVLEALREAVTGSFSPPSKWWGYMADTYFLCYLFIWRNRSWAWVGLQRHSIKQRHFILASV